MVFVGSYFLLDESNHFFQLIDSQAEVFIQCGTDGVYKVIVCSTSSKNLETTSIPIPSTPYSIDNIPLYAVIAPTSIVLHPESHSFLWSSSLKNTSSTTCYCLRVNSYNQFRIFQRAIHSIKRLCRAQMLHESILIELKIQNINDIKGLLKEAESQQNVPQNVPPNVPQMIKNNLAHTAKNTLPQTTKRIREDDGQEQQPKLKKNKIAHPPLIRTNKLPTISLDLVKICAPEAQMKTSKSNNSFIVSIQTSRHSKCHLCLQKKVPLILCQNRYMEHSFCGPCLETRFNLLLSDLQSGLYVWNCPSCNGKCSCKKCGGSNTLTPVPSMDALKQPCYLCQKKVPDNVSLTLHPVVQKDGRGKPVYCCRVCTEEILQRREKYRKDMDASTVNIHSEGLCALCADGGSGRSINLFTCSEEKCPRSYCMKCLKHLLEDHQIVAMQHQLKWTCTNCMRIDVVNLPAQEDKDEKIGDLKAKLEHQKQFVEPKKKKKRNRSILSKRQVKKKETLHVKEEGEVLPPINREMDAIDYTAQYIKFIVDRECGILPNGESEDSCFCCKDGGILMECDFRSGSFSCPKVYHTDCLGFEIPDHSEWICPRHHCSVCGIQSKFSCRFCTISYCEMHLPDDNFCIGQGSRELLDSMYIICNKCDAMRLEAVARGKLSKDHGIVDVQRRNSTPSWEENVEMLSMVWSNTEKALYEQAIECHYGDWEALAQCVGTKTAQECQNYHLDEYALDLVWREDEVSRFVQALVGQGKKTSSYWDAVSSKVGTRSALSCRKYYTFWRREDHHKSISSSSSSHRISIDVFKGKHSWTPDEVHQLYSLLKIHQTHRGTPDWARIASQIKTKSVDQCKNKIMNDNHRKNSKSKGSKRGRKPSKVVEANQDMDVLLETKEQQKLSMKNLSSKIKLDKKKPGTTIGEETMVRMETTTNTTPSIPHSKTNERTNRRWTRQRKFAETVVDSTTATTTTTTTSTTTTTTITKEVVLSKESERRNGNPEFNVRSRRTTRRSQEEILNQLKSIENENPTTLKQEEEECHNRSLSTHMTSSSKSKFHQGTSRPRRK